MVRSWVSPVPLAVLVGQVKQMSNTKPQLSFSIEMYLLAGAKCLKDFGNRNCPYWNLSAAAAVVANIVNDSLPCPFESIVEGAYSDEDFQSDFCRLN